MQQPQASQAGAPPQQPGQVMPQGQPGPGGQGQYRGMPNAAHQQQFMTMAAAQQQMQGMNPMMMQQMPNQGPPQAQGQPPQGQNFKMGGPQHQQQYRQKQPGGMGQQNQGNPGMKGGPMMYNNNQQMNPYFQIPGDFMNRGMGPSNMIFPNQNGTQQPPVKRDRGTLFSLYIGNLSKETYDLDLYKFFQSKGYRVQSAKVMFDKDTNKSLGFGYLNFIDEEESKKCMEEMNNQTINGKQIVLNKKKEQDFDSKANVIVRNLPKDIDQKQLMELFKEFGKIGSCKLEVFSDGQSRGFGYIQFLEAKSAEAAIEKLNDTKIGENSISVAVHSKKDDREAQSEKYTNLFVRNLPHDYNEAQLKNLFKDYGDINSISMDQSKKGQGFVGFKDHESAKKALEATNMKTQIDGQAIFVSSHIYKKESELQKSSQIEQNQKEMFKSNLYVKFIPLNTSKEEVETVFKQAGDIISIKLKNYEINEQPKYQIGYVLFENVKQAQKAIQLFDEVRGLFPDQMKPLKVDFWQAKDERQDAVRDKHVNYVTQLINQIKKSNSQGYNQGGPGGMQGGYNGPTQGNFQNDGNQNYRGGQRFQHRGRGGYRGRGGNMQNPRGGNQNYKQGYNNQGRQYNNNGQMRGQYNQQNNMQMGMQPGQQQMGQQPPQQQMGQQPPQQQVMMQEQQQQQMQQQVTPQQMMQLPQVDISQLDSLQGDDRNNFVGNHIYQTIHAAYGEQFAPTITGMLLDESAVEFKALLTQNQYFQAKAHEAYELLLQSKEQQNQEQMQAQMQQTQQNQ